MWQPFNPEGDGRAVRGRGDDLATRPMPPLAHATRQNGGQVETDALVVRSAGHLLGQGTVTGRFCQYLGRGRARGEHCPAVQRAGSCLWRSLGPGTLVISSSVALTKTGRYRSRYARPGQLDQLVIDGTASDYQLILHFGEGFAPQQADVFNFIPTGGAQAVLPLM
ncbi:MAG: hypothetical protein IPH82_02660 [Chloroflexi bacterium]|nr:hypothetical protein [Chloroflexota bacterium]